MTLALKAEPIDRDIELMLREDLLPAAQSKVFAQFAEQEIEDAKQTNRSVLGRVPRYTIAVDGRNGAPLASVKPDGVIVAEFELINDVLVWISDQLQTHSPVKSGRYKRSHTLFADANEVAPGAQIPAAQEYVFINSVPYARKLEMGKSSQAPDGVYQATAVLARQRFGNIAKVFFTYRGIVAGQQINPLIAGATKSKRNKRGRFIFQGGSRSHNVSANRFPAIYVRAN